VFRRKQDDEDPFAALKEATERGATRVASTASRRADDGDGARTGTQPRPLALDQASLPLPAAQRSRRGSDGLLVLLTVALVLGGGGALVWQSQRAADEQLARAAGHGSEAGVDRPGDDDAVTDRPAEPAPAQAVPYDLVGPAGFERAIRAIRGELRSGERVWLLRVARDRVSAITALPDGRQRLVNVADDLSVDVNVAGEAGDHTALPLTKIPAGAPARAVRGAAAKGGLPAEKLDYLVMNGLPAVFREAPSWSLFFRATGRRPDHFTAPLAGAPVSVPGEAGRP
jgi:hypothetical protein